MQHLPNSLQHLPTERSPNGHLAPRTPQAVRAPLKDIGRLGGSIFCLAAWYPQAPNVCQRVPVAAWLKWI